MMDDDCVAAVIVSYNSARFLDACLEAALRYCHDVIVVDNGSADDSVDAARRHSGVRVIANLENRGFAAAVNQGIRESSAPYLLVLNPDAILQTPVSRLVLACSRGGAACAAGKLIDASGHPQRGFTLRRLPTASTLVFEAAGLNRVWSSNPINRRYRCLDVNLELPQQVEQPAGAFFLVTRKVWESLRGFDERFQPVWFEDVDFAKRLKAAGHWIQYEPEVTAQHHGAHSVDELDPAIRRQYWYYNLLTYAGKHMRRWQVRCVAAAVVAGCAGRVLRGSLAGSPGNRRGYGRVVKFAARYLLFGPTAGQAF
jgi:GT2 family glycosyltransferase